MEVAVGQCINIMVCDSIKLALELHWLIIDESDRHRRDLISLMMEGSVLVRTNEFIQQVLRDAVTKE